MGNDIPTRPIEIEDSCSTESVKRIRRGEECDIEILKSDIRADDLKVKVDLIESMDGGLSNRFEIIRETEVRKGKYVVSAADRGDGKKIAASFNFNRGGVF